MTLKNLKFVGLLLVLGLLVFIPVMFGVMIHAAASVFYCYCRSLFTGRYYQITISTHKFDVNVREVY